MTDLVKMVREADGKTADVHPDMVEHYQRGGYAAAEEVSAEMTKAEIIAAIEALGVDPDGRWSKSRLAEQLEELRGVE